MAGSGVSEPWRQLIPSARFSNKFQMKSVRLLSNIIFGDSQTRFVPIYCARSWIIVLPDAQSNAFSTVHLGCRPHGSQRMAPTPESGVRRVPRDSKPCSPLPQSSKGRAETARWPLLPAALQERTSSDHHPSCPPPSWAPLSSQPGKPVLPKIGLLESFQPSPGSWGCLV